MQSDSISTCQPARHRSAGFTLTELLVVIGIIVLFISLAIPAFSAISGTRSIAGAENNLSALLSRAREEAIAQADTSGPGWRGVMFYVDPATDTVTGMIVRSTPSTMTDGANNTAVLLDPVVGHDYLTFPKGVRLRTVFDGVQAGGLTDRYLGFNSAPSGAGKFGGVILFDIHGRLIVQRYAFFSGIGDSVIANGGAAPFIPTVNGSNIAPLSQIGVAFFDKRIFQGQGFNDTNGSNEDAVDSWIDSNSTAVLINRFTGALIKGE